MSGSSRRICPDSMLVTILLLFWMNSSTLFNKKVFRMNHWLPFLYLIKHKAVTNWKRSLFRWNVLDVKQIICSGVIMRRLGEWVWYCSIIFKRSYLCQDLGCFISLSDASYELVLKVHCPGWTGCAFPLALRKSFYICIAISETRTTAWATSVFNGNESIVTYRLVR